MDQYKIVNLTLESEQMPDCFQNFKCEPEEGRDVLPVIYRPLAQLQDSFTPSAEVSGLRIGPGGPGWIFEDVSTGCRMRIPSDYSYAELSEEVQQEPLLQAFLLQLFIEGRLLDEGVLTVHSSCVELSGKAFAFSGPSGCGKSTRASVWVRSFGASVISGDRPAMWVAKRKVFGIPWDGKEQIFANVQAEIGAILEVRRSPFTRLRRLSFRQARNFLISQIFVPMWDSDRAMLAMILLNKMVREFPVYRIFCDMDLKAAEETREILFEHQEKIWEEREDMKLNEGFVLKRMAGESVLMPTGTNIAKFNGTVLLNEVSAFVVGTLAAGPCSLEDLADLLLKEYDVDRETALQDLKELTGKLAEMGVISLEE